MARKPTKLMRQMVIQRAETRCEYCLSPQQFSTDLFHVDHILPVILGGETHLENLAYSCSGCNTFKGTRIESADPITLRSVLLFNPRQDIWHEHFRWSDDALELLGLTPCGRATIELLNMNRSSVQNLRFALALVGIHPPN